MRRENCGNPAVPADPPVAMWAHAMASLTPP